MYGLYNFRVSQYNTRIVLRKYRPTLFYKPAYETRIEFVSFCHSHESLVTNNRLEMLLIVSVVILIASLIVVIV